MSISIWSKAIGSACACSNVWSSRADLLAPLLDEPLVLLRPCMRERILHEGEISAQHLLQADDRALDYRADVPGAGRDGVAPRDGVGGVRAGARVGPARRANVEEETTCGGSIPTSW